MMVLLAGANGNMGRRYAAILDWLNYLWIGTEEIEAFSFESVAPREITHIILATPTDLHAKHLTFLKDFPGKVLCEKPLYKSAEPPEGFSYPKQAYMVNNYAFTCGDTFTLNSRGAETYYNYYNTGRDGLYWDCIQLIKLAKGSLDLKNTLPWWECKINGWNIKRSEIDLSYVRMIRDFLGLGGDGLRLWHVEDCFEAHRKANYCQAGYDLRKALNAEIPRCFPEFPEGIKSINPLP